VADAEDHADGNRDHAPEDRSEAPPAARSPNLEPAQRSSDARSPFGTRLCTLVEPSANVILCAQLASPT
jgi:hypothetical protein